MNKSFERKSDGHKRKSRKHCNNPRRQSEGYQQSDGAKVKVYVLSLEFKKAKQ